MFGRNPLEKMHPMDELSTCDALRLALIAEIDAITLYSQLARASSDPLVKRVFLEVAEEEKEHMGEFLYLLKKCDLTLEKMMNEGEKEVKEYE